MKKHLCFHGIGTCVQEREPGEAHYWVSERVFLRVLDDVADRGDVQLSFDDGNKSDISIALPALVERGLTATFFALAGRLGEPDSLSADDLASLRQAGMAIGTHGWAHVPWRGLADADARRELVDARTALEEAGGAKITEAALPLGRYDRRLLRRLKHARYDTVYTSDRFPARDGSWLQARYSLTADDTAESAGRILRHRPGAAELRNVLASAAKRMR